MPRTISILHVSDLHISKSEIDSQSVVLQALWSDLQARRSSGAPPIDLIFFTGDLIAKGCYSPENIQAARACFIDPLLEATGLSNDRLFIVPGNHDVALNRRSKFIAPIYAAIDNQERVREYFLESSRTSLSNGLEDFNGLVASMNLPKPVLENAHYRAYKTTIAGVQIGICALNSAWRASGSPNNADYGKLVVGRQQLDDVIGAVGTCDLVFGLLHHPISWLALFDSGVVQRQLYTHFDAIFFGHNHEGDGALIAGSAGTYLASNAGCLYQHRDYYNGYSLLTFEPDSNKWIVEAQEYFESRKCFDKSLRFAPDGRQTYSVSRRNGSSLNALPSEAFVGAVNEAANNRMLSSLISDVAPKSLKALFVEPPLSRVSQRQLSGERKYNSKVYVPLRELLASTVPIIFIGPRQSGKTTLLHRICCESGELNLNGYPPFAGYIDLHNPSDTRAKILEEIVRFSSGAYRRSEFLEFLNAGLVAVCFDNLDVASTRQVQTIAAFTREFPKCRYFFTYKEDVEASVTSDVLPDIGVASDAIYIHSFGRRETRLLTARWYGEAEEKSGEKVDEILLSLGRLGIRRTPFLISALLWIKESNLEFTPVNRAAILDALIDGMLEKIGESKDRSAFDSTIKRHFLSAFAEHLFRSQCHSVSASELEKFAVEYFSKRALHSAISPFIDILYARGILLNVRDQVFFKFDCVRAYFLSLRLRESQDFRRMALSQEYFLLLAEELDYMTSSTRDDIESLRSAVDLLSAFRDRADIGVELSYFDDVSLHGSPLDQANQAQLTAKILGARLHGEKHEQLLDKLDRPPSVTEAGQRDADFVARQTNPFQDFLVALQTTSSILRNSELVEDIPLKHQAYELVSRCWCEIVIGILIAIDFLDDNPTAIEEVLGTMPFLDRKNANYYLKVMSPAIVMSYALESLGSPKLQIIIEQSLQDDRQTVRRLVDTFLYVDLLLPGRFRYLKDLLTSYGSNRLITELTYYKVATQFLFGRLTNVEEDQVRDLIGHSAGLVASTKTRVEKDRLKNRVIADLEKKRLVSAPD